jgi:hypothetical protein
MAIFCCIANAFEIGYCFDYHYHHTQVARSGLAARDDAGAAFVYVRFHRIDAVVVGDDAIHQCRISASQRLNGKPGLFFRHLAHQQYAFAYRFKLRIVLL